MSNIIPFLPYPKELLLQIQVLAIRYLEKPTAKMEEQMLVLLAGAIRRHCESIPIIHSEQCDLQQIARLASTKALRTYNPAKGSFYRWSRKCVWQDVGNYLDAESGIIKVPRREKGEITFQYITLEALEALECSSEWED